MIIGDKRETVVENIKKAVEDGDFYRKVEVSDPIVTDSEAMKICENYLFEKGTLFYKIKSSAAQFIAGILTRKINKDTEVIGVEKIHGLKGGFIVTSNHFSPLENTCVRYGLWAIGKRKLAIVSQVSNFAMGGLVGFFMNYANTIPLFKEHRYLSRDFFGEIKKSIDKNEAVLIYPEEEMWFNYRKPRIPKSGAYYFASKLNVPILSMFVEIDDTNDIEIERFNKVKYKVHLLKVIYPDENKKVRENCDAMCREDYELKKEAYERIYGEELTYDFSTFDIGGYNA